ncbi:MAG: twin-arginine translocase subunit TatC [Bacteroidaceae bacterium]|nr:twin-arginine translocase subunit TatC [Bacteroidaceae bacterium]
MSNELTFWDHLDELRGCLWRIVASVTIASVVAFCLKEPLFDIILAPCHSDFILYRLLGAEPFSIHLINTGLAEQMLIHIKVAMCIGVIAASPYIIYVLFGFISPALYDNERRHSVRLTVAAYIMFFVGILVNYFLIFPLTVRFLGQYQVSEDIDNMLTISSYIDTLMMLSISFGIIFEIPVLSWLLATFGLLKASWMSRYRRQAIVAILIISAIITPTTDVFTLFIVALPIWMLYEISIGIVKFAKG